MATPGTWQILHSAPISAAPFNGGTMQFALLLPDSYDPTKKYTLVHVGHPNDSGQSGGVYPRNGQDYVTTAMFGNIPSTGAGVSLDSVLNSPAFRAQFPAIVFSVQVNQTIDGSGSSPNSNGGGFNDQQNSSGNEIGLNMIAQSIIAGQVGGVAPGSVSNLHILAGYSLGGIQGLAEIVDNNQFNGPSGLNLWTACITWSDQLFRPGISNSTYFQRMAGVPLTVCSTSSDNVPNSYDQPAWDTYMGNTSPGVPHPYPTQANYDQGGMAAIQAAGTKFHYIDFGSAQPAQTFFPLNSQGGDGTAIWEWAFAQVPPGGSTTTTGTPVTASANDTVVTAAGGGSITDANGGVWTIAGGVVMQNGAAAGLSSNVLEIAFVSGVVWQENSANLWWSWDGSAWVSPAGTNNNGTATSPLPATTPVTPPATKGFTISNGQVIHPNGSVFVGRGINVRNDQLPTVCTNAACQPLTTKFPGISIVRLYYESGTNPYITTGFEPMVSQLTAAGIVVLIEDHTGISQPPYTGATLAAELAWYTTLATTYKNNPFVWFGTFNEPGQGLGTDLAAIASQEASIYNAIRATGNTSIVAMEEPSGGNVGLVGQMPASVYAEMFSIVFDLHFYSHTVNKVTGGNSTDIPTILNVLAGSASGAFGVAACQIIRSADGLVPVIIGESGNSTDGVNVDPNGPQIVQAVSESGHSFMFWAWDPDETGDQAVTDGGVLTAYGTQLASLIAAAANVTPPAPVTPTANDTVVTTTSGGSITDGSGNVFTMDSGNGGEILENGTVVPGSGGTSEITIVAGVIWAQSAAAGNTGAWFTLANGVFTAQSGTPPGLPAPAPVGTVPVVPGGLTVGLFTDTTVGLSWFADSTGNTVSYNVLMQTGGAGDFVSIGTTTTTTFTATGLAPSTLYVFEVEGVNATGTSAPSTAANVATNLPPTTPAQVAAEIQQAESLIAQGQSILAKAQLDVTKIIVA